MSLPFTIRQYKEPDLQDVWNIWHTALGNLTLEQVPSIEDYKSDDDDLLRIPEYYLNGEGEFLVGVYSGKVVAICGMKKSSSVKGEIRHMSVDFNLHRRGFGRKMMGAMEERAVESGCKLLHLDTGIGQTPAQALYLSCGFHETGRTFVGTGHWEIILYEKEIG